MCTNANQFDYTSLFDMHFCSDIRKNILAWKLVNLINILGNFNLSYSQQIYSKLFHNNFILHKLKIQVYCVSCPPPPRIQYPIYVWYWLMYLGNQNKKHLHNFNAEKNSFALIIKCLSSVKPENVKHVASSWKYILDSKYHYAIQCQTYSWLENNLKQFYGI